MEIIQIEMGRPGYMLYLFLLASLIDVIVSVESEPHLLKLKISEEDAR